MNRKWINNTLNCEAYSSFEGVSSDCRIVTTKIHRSRRRNAVQTTKIIHSDWSLLNNRDISDKYTITLRNKFDALQKISETLTPIDKYENFVKPFLEVTAECIITKLRAKHRLKKNVTTRKPHLYAIGETQLMPTLRKLRKHKVN